MRLDSAQRVSAELTVQLLAKQREPNSYPCHARLYCSPCGASSSKRLAPARLRSLDAVGAGVCATTWSAPEVRAQRIEGLTSEQSVDTHDMERVDTWMAKPGDTPLAKRGCCSQPQTEDWQL